MISHRLLKSYRIRKVHIQLMQARNLQILAKGVHKSKHRILPAIMEETFKKILKSATLSPICRDVQFL